jgi:ABC-type phosphate transport system substrate-binding protein
MTTSNLKAKLAKAAAAVTVLAVGAGSVLVGSGPAGADPKQASALIGVGSDTTQDVMNAYAGENFGINYTPVQSSAASGRRQLVSWDSTNPDPTGDRCITTKVKSATIYRPNGSGSGRNALSRSILGTGVWGTPAPECGGPKGISGLVDFARSSNRSTTAGNDLVYLPFGRDFVGYAYYFKPIGGGAPLTGNVTFTQAELAQLHTTSTVAPAAPLQFDPDGPGSVWPGPVPVIPCGIQTGSGTGQFWQQALTGTTGGDQNATSACRLLAGGNTGTLNGGPGRLQESDGAGLAAKGDQVPGTMVIIGYSAANFISSSNQVTKSTLVPGVQMGNISTIVPNNDPNRLPWVGTAPNLTPNTAYYANATFGRDVYNVFDASLFDPLFPSANQDIKTIFGVGGAICNVGTGTFANPQAGTPQATRATFGFGPSVDTCGGTTNTSAFGTGTV